MEADYHPLAIRLWSVMTIHNDGRHEIPSAVERATQVLLRRIDEPRELLWAHSSLYSLWAETRRLGQREASEAFWRLVSEARSLTMQRADVWREREAPRPEAPDAIPVQRPAPTPTRHPQTLGALLSNQPRRA